MWGCPIKNSWVKICENRVRTTRGSGWPFVIRLCRVAQGHPLPRVVLTCSRRLLNFRWMTLMPVGLRLVVVGKLKQLTLAPGGADELDACGQSVLAEAVRHGDRGHADEVAGADGRRGADAGVS